MQKRKFCAFVHVSSSAECLSYEGKSSQLLRVYDEKEISFVHKLMRRFFFNEIDSFVHSYVRAQQNDQIFDRRQQKNVDEKMAKTKAMRAHVKHRRNEKTGNFIISCHNFCSFFSSPFLMRWHGVCGREMYAAVHYECVQLSVFFSLLYQRNFHNYTVMTLWMWD